jgi:two-component system sensor histidine kinase/response regulator
MENKELSAQFFLSSLSHEIRTPLNGIFGYTQLLSQTKLDSSQKKYINSMNQCCIRLIELVNDILDFSKLTTGTPHINNECFSLREIFEELKNVLDYRIKEKKQKLHFNVEKNFPEYIISDKKKILQILINLISNSNKFTQSGGTIILSVELKIDNFVEFSVEDNGIGLTEENQKKLFNPFFQVHETITKNGSGLGLAICKKLVEILGGEITIESEKNQGSTFRFDVKYQSHEEFEKHVLNNSEILKDKYILIIDENTENRLQLGEVLFDNGMKPVICSSGKEGIRMVQKNRYPFCCVLIDNCVSDINCNIISKKIKDIVDIPLLCINSTNENYENNNFEYIVNHPINHIVMFDYISKLLLKNDINKYELNYISENEKIIAPKRDIKILIAEDVVYSLDLLMKMLDNMNYKNIDFVVNGEEAIKKIDYNFTNKTPYEILLLDLKMPLVDGFSVAEHIKQNKYTYPKIIVITASVLENDKEKCRKLGIKYFLLKPFSFQQLKLILNNMLLEI